ncbi:MAG: class I tRNA ligase family protein, partial [Caulobacteraceae bacterium]
FEPRNWEKTYFEWMRNIEPWCISRQLWWGHRIPAWYGPDGRIFVEESEAAASAAAREHYGHDEPLRQDEDVLDTWFSSALWPFSTLGWPDKTPDLERFYPTDTLVTGFDIIFYWVARMIMMGLHFTGEVPFRRVFFNALIRDDQGAKMSKTKGNVLDPLELVDTYGADALRFTVTAMSGQARDIKLSRQRIEGYRNFGTKLWNAARFCQMNGCTPRERFDPAALALALNRWIRGETFRAAQIVTASIDRCAFDDAADALYRFIWNVFCDWYLEFAKPVLSGVDEAAKAETQAMAAWTLETALKLLHPVMPFLSEELWGKTRSRRSRPGLLITTAWPELPASYLDAAAEGEIGLVIATVTEGRVARAELNVPPSARPDLIIVEARPDQRGALEANAAAIAHTLRIGNLVSASRIPEGAIAIVVEGATLALAIAEYIDLTAERARLAKEIASRAADVERAERKLDNPEFVDRAPPEVVEENRAKLAEAREAMVRLKTALARLEGLVASVRIDGN